MTHQHRSILLFAALTLFGVPSVAVAQSVALTTGKYEVTVPYSEGGVEFPFVAYDEFGGLVWPKVTRIKTEGKPDQLRFTHDSNEKYWVTDKPYPHDGASKKAVDDLTNMLAKLNRPRADDGCLKMEVLYAKMLYMHGVPMLSMRPVEEDLGEFTLIRHELWFEAEENNPFVVYDPKNPTKPFTSKVVIDEDGGVKYVHESQERFDFFGGSIDQEQWERSYQPAPKGTKSSSS